MVSSAVALTRNMRTVLTEVEMWLLIFFVVGAAFGWFAHIYYTSDKIGG